MDVHFVTQPFEDGSDLRDFVRAVAEDPELTTLRMVVAWAKRSGLSRVAGDLAVIRGRRGKVLAIAGVSEGGATYQGLEALARQTDEAYIFHDAGRTFHPKVFLADSADRALLLVGSHNLTAGGVAWNYEAGLSVSLDLSQEIDRNIRDHVVSYFDRLQSDTDVCIRLTDQSIEQMRTDGTLLIQDEDKSRRRITKPEPDAPEDTDSDIVDDPVPSVFGRSSIPKRKAPSPAPKRLPLVPPTPSVPEGSTAPEIEVVKRWYKKMDGTAAQRPPGAQTKVTGNLRLSQETFAIDHKKWFHEVLFGGMPWTPRPGDARFDTLNVPMQVAINGEYLGIKNFDISHAEHRISGQGNVPTVLHWSPLRAILQANNYVGYYVNLERGLGNEFRLTISTAPVGEFIF